ncbi:hypothetical protein SAMN04487890_102226 [Mucilaginibacter polytrichastri]|nr:hypothetical protein SAMN04487890_102226 [Mucilaginibacter polytrichastri]
MVQLSSVECMDINGGDTNGLMHGNTGSNNGFIYLYNAGATVVGFVAGFFA